MVKGMKKAAYTLDSAGTKIPMDEVHEFDKQVSAEFGKDTKAGGWVRIQARVSRETFEYIQKEAYRTGTNISAIASIYIADKVEEHKKEKKMKTSE